MHTRWLALLVFALVVIPLCRRLPCAAAAEGEETANGRKPANDVELRYWLVNMIAYHRFAPQEVADATGMSREEIDAAVRRLGIASSDRLPRRPGEPLTVLPYPGGRHPRIGFLEGAIRPQRETKISVFLPWDETSYVVADVPEAIWSNLGLTYLAHTHVPTIWTKQQVELEPLEWNRQADGTLDFERKLPDGIRFGTKVMPTSSAVLLEMWLTNGTPEPLSDLRVQNCVMLKGASGFEQQTVDNKVFRKPFAACRSSDGRHWVISAWEPCHRAWSNAPCPCLHSDPKFPDCAPGETQRIEGWLSFFEGTDIAAEFERIEASGWREEIRRRRTQPAR